MKELESAIRNFLIEANNLYPNIQFKLGYGRSENTYIVEVSPYSEYRNNEEYAKMEYEFCKFVLCDYIDYNVIFVGDGESYRVSEYICKIGYIEPQKPIEPKSSLNNDEWKAERNCAGLKEYARAA